MIRFIAVTVMSCILFASPVEARKFAPECNVTMPCVGAPQGSAHMNDGGHIVTSVARHASRSLSGVHHALASKVRAIQATCPGITIISTIRHTRIRGGGGAISKHASGRAVDITAPGHNYACVYSQLTDWPSYSTDGRRCRHVHISLGESVFRHRYC